MPQNAIQFQRGLSDTRFQELYGTEALCLDVVERMRWPNGFVCPRCEHDDAHRLERRALLQCALCRKQVSVTAGTIFDSTKLPLTTWFRAMHHLTASKNGVAALELKRRLGVSYRSAWLSKQKLSDVMRQRESTRTFTERVEIDDAYLGGERAARPGHAGRGADSKIPFIACRCTQVLDAGRHGHHVVGPHEADGDERWAGQVRSSRRSTWAMRG